MGHATPVPFAQLYPFGFSTGDWVAPHLAGLARCECGIKALLPVVILESSRHQYLAPVELRFGRRPNETI